MLINGPNIGKSDEVLNPLGIACAVANDDLIKVVLLMLMLHPRHNGFRWHHLAGQNTIEFTVD